MPSRPRILAFAGSTRSGSFNKQLLAIAVGAAREVAEVTVIDLRDFPLPLYDGDLESSSGLPEHARTLKELMRSHRGLLISAPEYNSSISGVLKNAIDWMSRAAANEPPLAAFEHKVAGLLSASPGALGGARGLIVLRMLLGNIKVLVLPGQFSLTKAHEAFNPDGTLKDPKQHAQAQAVGRDVANTVRALSEAAVTG